MIKNRTDFDIYTQMNSKIGFSGVGQLLLLSPSASLNLIQVELLRCQPKPAQNQGDSLAYLNF